MSGQWTDWEAWRMWKGCSRKVKFHHEGQARRAGHKVNQRAYRCAYCDGWHLTSQSGGRR